MVLKNETSLTSGGLKPEGISPKCEKVLGKFAENHRKSRASCKIIQVKQKCVSAIRQTKLKKPSMYKNFASLAKIVQILENLYIDTLLNTLCMLDFCTNFFMI